MGAYGTNDAEVRGIACEFPVAGHMLTGNAAEGWVLEECDGRISTTGNWDTVAQDICGK